MVGTPRILILANQETGVLVEQALRGSHKVYTAKRAETRKDFQALVSEFIPDLIIADLSMGISESPADIPLLCISDCPEAEVEALAKGAADFVTKDRMGRLLFTVNRVIQEMEYRSERKRLRDELQKIEERYCAMISNISDVIMLISPAGTIPYAGPSTPKVLGHSAETFIGRSIFDVIHPFDKDYMLREWNSFVQKPGETAVVQFRARHKNGTWLWFEGVGRNLIADTAVESVVANFHVMREPPDVQR